MAGLVKELMIDLADGKLDPITKLDLIVSIERLVQTGQIGKEHINAIKLFVSGVSVLEMSLPNAQELLSTAFALIEEESNYLDSFFLSRCMSIYPRYNTIRGAIERRLFEHGREFKEYL